MNVDEVWHRNSKKVLFSLINTYNIGMFKEKETFLTTFTLDLNVYSLCILVSFVDSFVSRLL